MASNIAARWCADQGVGGRALDVPMVASAPTGTWRVRAFSDPKRPAGRRDDASWSKTTCRIGSSSILRRTASSISKARAGRGHGRRPLSSTARRPPTSSSKARSMIAPAERAPRLCRLSVSVSPMRRSRADAGSRSRTCRRPIARARPSSPSPRQAARRHAAVRGAGHRAHGRGRRPCGRAQADAAGDAGRRHDRRQAAVLRPFARRRREGDVRRRRRRAGWHAARAQRPALRTVAGRDALSVVSPRRHLGLRAGQDAPRASPTARSMSPPTRRRAFRCRCSGAAIGSKSRPATATGR